MFVAQTIYPNRTGMFSFFKKQPEQQQKATSFINIVKGFFSNLTNEQRKSIYIFVMYFFPDEEYMVGQSEILATRLREQYEYGLGASIDDFTSNGNDRKFLQDVKSLPTSDKKMIAMMIFGFHKVVSMPVSAMVEEFDFMERGGITMELYNDAIRDFEKLSGGKN